MSKIMRSIIRTSTGEYVEITTTHFPSRSQAYYQTLVFLSWDDKGTKHWFEEAELEEHHNEKDAIEGHLAMVKNWVIPSQSRIDRLKKIRSDYKRWRYEVDAVKEYEEN